MNRDGSGVRGVTNHPTIDVTPTWSPTGNADRVHLRSHRHAADLHHERRRHAAAADHQRVVLRSADLVAGAAQRDRLLRRGPAAATTSRSSISRRAARARSPTTSATTRARRSRRTAATSRSCRRRAGKEQIFTIAPRRHGTAADHQDGNEPLSELVEIADRRTPRSDASEMTMHRQRILLRDGVDARGWLAAAARRSRRSPGRRRRPSRPRRPTRTARRRRRRRSPSRAGAARADRRGSDLPARDIDDINKNSPVPAGVLRLRQLRGRRGRRSRR